MRAPPGPAMTLANMRQNRVRAVIASCANCGRSADVNVDLLPETPDGPGDWQTAPLQQLRRQDDLDPTCMAYREPTSRHARLSPRTTANLLGQVAEDLHLENGRSVSRDSLMLRPARQTFVRRTPTPARACETRPGTHGKREPNALAAGGFLTRLALYERLQLRLLATASTRRSCPQEHSAAPEGRKWQKIGRKKQARPAVQAAQGQHVVLPGEFAQTTQGDAGGLPLASRAS
jgi:hypothetical protein